MNFRIVRFFLSRLLLVEAGLMLLPIIIGLLYREPFSNISSFLAAIFIIVLVGVLLNVKKPDIKTLHTKEGMIIVALTWIGWTCFGALPFVISGEIPFYIDAVFEMASGFTTTGASILREVESLSHSILFWRSFSHLIGGMGVLVFALAIFPTGASETVHLMRAEVPGPKFGKLVSRLKQTAMILYVIYFAMTFITIILLILGGMNVFDAVCHSFGIAGTGGFSTRNASIGYYNSPYIEWVVGIMMMLFGVNFNLFYMILLGQVISVWRDEELRVYLGVIFSATAVIVISNSLNGIYENLGENIRHTFFSVSSIITTTGFLTVDFSRWSLTAITIFAMLMIIGGMAGSTGGGLKVARFTVAGKSMFNEFRLMQNPRRVVVTKFNDKPLTEDQVTRVRNYVLAYIFCAIIIYFLVSLDTHDMQTTVSATLITFNNIGAGFATAGSSAPFTDYSIFSKIVLTFSMIAGRLEIYPIILLFSPSTYLNKS
ncbi:MAG: TrkH family potassium uptake protein [Clostridiaceae bacterium]|nr:TrkH family potassium uptake protein [Clostridiaceae bacterium]